MLFCASVHAEFVELRAPTTVPYYTGSLQRDPGIVGGDPKSPRTIYVCLDGKRGNNRIASKLEKLGWRTTTVDAIYVGSRELESCTDDDCWLYEETKQVGYSIVADTDGSHEQAELAEWRNEVSTTFVDGTDAAAFSRRFSMLEGARVSQQGDRISAFVPYGEQPLIVEFGVRVSCRVESGTLHECQLGTIAVPLDKRLAPDPSNQAEG